MSNLKIPSLQHLARIWQKTPEGVANKLVDLARNSPTFSYDIFKNITFDIMNLGTLEEQTIRAILLKEKRERIQRTFLEIVPLLHGHCRNIATQYIQAVAPQYYPLGRGLRIPFSPTLIYSQNNQIFLPWFIFWKTNTFTKDQFSLFVTLVEEMLLQDPDLENAKLQILDFSAPNKKGPRTFKLIESDDIPRLSDPLKNQMLSIFVEGFELARKMLDEEEPVQKSIVETYVDKNQLSLLDN